MAMCKVYMTEKVMFVAMLPMRNKKATAKVVAVFLFSAFRRDTGNR